MKLLTTTTRNNKASNVYEIENLNEVKNIYADSNDTYYYKNYQFTLVRVNNDINGNPLYKITLSKDFEYITAQLKGLVTRTYVSKNYGLIQSYNLQDDLKRIFEKLEK